MTCKKEGRVMRYIGETSRSMFERRAEHEADRRSEKRKEKSHSW